MNLLKFCLDDTNEDKLEEQARKWLSSLKKTKEGYLLVDLAEERLMAGILRRKSQELLSDRKERERPYRTFDKMRQIGKSLVSMLTGM